MLTLNPRKGRRAPAPLAVQPDHLAEVLRHVEVLAGALMGFRAMRLSGELTPALKGEREASCRRRAQHLLTFSERAAVINALKTRAEVRTRMEGRGCPLPPQHVLFLSVQNFSTGEGYGIIEVLGEAVQAGGIQLSAKQPRQWRSRPCSPCWRT